MSKIMSPPLLLKRGDLVKVADDLGESMAHFPSGIEGIVIGSSQSSSGWPNSYTLMLLPSGGECSWYYETQLTFIAYLGDDAITDVRASREARDAKESDLEWIEPPV